MSKRRRDDLDGEEQDFGPQKSSEAPDYRRQRQIADTFAQAAKQLGAAFRLARAFERQKLGRRKKNAAREKNDSKMARIDTEIAALKALDSVLSAQNFLARALLKIKAVATSTHLPAELRTPKPVSTDAAALNVHARLCNSNPVKQAFPSAFASVEREVGIIDDVAPQKRQKRLRAKDYQVKQSPSVRSDEVEEETSASNSEEGLIAPRSSGEDDSDEDADSYSSTGNIDDLERRIEEEGISRHQSSRPSSKYDLAADLSLSDEDELSKDGASRQVPTWKKQRFIPALTMGGYISGSESEVEEIEDSKPKKNRRGQRARQAIWEQKYGKQAKHLQHQDTKQGWDHKRGAVDGNQRGKKGQDGSRFAKAANSLPLGKNRNLSRTGAAHSEVKKQRRDDNGPLHPSWEAAKRAKEKKSVPVAFQGKKISFD